ncbi:MAG: hypothetical protein IPO81_08240 [Kouleothrix sp.]|nr:hypothetical protein [Kouleothrix sp.]
MIDQGYQREAMFWIAGFLLFANAATQADAPAAEKPRFAAPGAAARRRSGAAIVAAELAVVAVVLALMIVKPF